MSSNHTSRPGPVGGFPTGSISIEGKRYSLAKATLLAWGSRKGWQAPFENDYYTFLYRASDGTYFVLLDLPIPGDFSYTIRYPAFWAEYLFMFMLKEKANLVTFEEAFPGFDPSDLLSRLAEAHTALSPFSYRKPHRPPGIGI